jgi:excisionase family DNA binding protein
MPAIKLKSLKATNKAVCRPGRRKAHARPRCLAYRVAEAAEVSGIGRSKMYEAIGTGELPARKFGSTTLILAVDLEGWLTSLPGFAEAKAPALSGLRAKLKRNDAPAGSVANGHIDQHAVVRGEPDGETDGAVGRAGRRGKRAASRASCPDLERLSDKPDIGS